MPPGWMVPVRGAETSPVRINSSKNTRHFEHRHVGPHKLEMKTEEEVGLMPPKWS